MSRPPLPDCWIHFVETSKMHAKAATISTYATIAPTFVATTRHTAATISGIA